jgi:hypothetical protein
MIVGTVGTLQPGDYAFVTGISLRVGERVRLCCYDATDDKWTCTDEAGDFVKYPPESLTKDEDSRICASCLKPIPKPGSGGGSGDMCSESFQCLRAQRDHYWDCLGRYENLLKQEHRRHGAKSKVTQENQPAITFERAGKLGRLDVHWVDGGDTVATPEDLNAADYYTSIQNSNMYLNVSSQLQELHEQVAQMCEAMGSKRDEVPCDSWHLRDLIVKQTKGVATEHAGREEAVADARRMHYLGNVIRARSQAEQDELTRLMRKYPPEPVPTPSPPSEACGHLIRDGQTTIGACQRGAGHDGEHQRGVEQKPICPETYCALLADHEGVCRLVGDPLSPPSEGPASPVALELSDLRNDLLDIAEDRATRFRTTEGQLAKARVTELGEQLRAQAAELALLRELERLDSFTACLGCGEPKHKCCCLTSPKQVIRTKLDAIRSKPASPVVEVETDICDNEHGKDIYGDAWLLARGIPTGEAKYSSTGAPVVADQTTTPVEHRTANPELALGDAEKTESPSCSAGVGVAVSPVAPVAEGELCSCGAPPHGPKACEPPPASPPASDADGEKVAFPNIQECAFCDKKRTNVAHLFSGGERGPAICNECVSLCLKSATDWFKPPAPPQSPQPADDVLTRIIAALTRCGEQQFSVPDARVLARQLADELAKGA